MTHTILSAADMHAITNEELTASPDLLAGLIRTGEQAFLKGEKDYLGSLTENAYAEVRFNEWAQSILGTDMHLSVGNQERPNPTLSVQPGVTLTDADIDSIMKVVYFLTEAGVNRVTLRKEDTIPADNGGEFYFNVTLDIIHEMGAVLSGFKALKYSDEPFVKLHAYGSTFKNWNTFRDINAENFNEFAANA